MIKDNDKINYLIKTLSRTNKKDFENYVINAIYHKVGNSNLIPVTQQYVKSGNKYYFLDLYFPQINLAVEINEKHHLKQINKDLFRKDKIISAIDISKKGTIVEFIEENDYKKVELRINEIVNIIRKKIKFNKLNWQTYEETLLKLKKRGYLTTEDNFIFKKIKDITMLFGIEYNGQSAYVIMKSKINDVIWCPTLSVIVKGKETNNKGWANILSKDWLEIVEKKKNRKKSDFEKLEKEANKKIRRLTFAKVKNNLGQSGYRYIGAFIVDKNFSRAKIEIKFSLDRKTSRINLK